MYNILATLKKEAIKIRNTDWKEKAFTSWEWVKTNKLKTVGYFSGGLFFSVLLLVLLIYLGLFGKIPSAEQLKLIKNPVASVIYGSNKEAIGQFFVQNRSNIDSSEVNNYIKNALIATEDIRFRAHNGIDLRSYGRVLIKSILLQQESSGGGSTITQQLAKNLFGRKKRFLIATPVNKIKEMIIALRLEKVYSKEDILLLYLNTVSFGENLYGLEKPAKRFFNKAPKQLTLEESATLIGLLKAPSYYNPKNNPERASARRNVVLAQMGKYGFITQEELEKAQIKPLKLDYQVSKIKASFATYYKEFLKEEFNKWAIENPKPDGTLYDVALDGLHIYTTVHPSIQRSAEAAAMKHIPSLQKSFDSNWEVTSDKDKESFLKALILNHPIAKEKASKGLSPEEILTLFDQKSARSTWTWEGFVMQELSLKELLIKELTTLHTGILVMNSNTGGIMAYVGGNDYGYSQYDNVQIPRQVGSTFKPIAYLGALEAGKEPCDFYDNNLVSYNQYEGWTPKNADGKYGGSYSMFGALAHSVNTVSVQIILQTGVNQIINLARRMGIQSPLPVVPSLVLGTADVPLQEMIMAYSSIANNGRSVQSYSIVKIEDEHRKILYTAKPGKDSKIVASPESLEKLRKMMEHVSTEGTGTRMQAYNIPYNIIGKTGTTQNNSDGWYIGCTPEIVAGAWVGTLDKRIHFKSSSLGSGGNTSLPMVARIFADLSRWNTPIISDFSYSIPDFYCPAYSELNAEDAYSTFINEPFVIDSLQFEDGDSLYPPEEQLDTLMMVDSLEN